MRIDMIFTAAQTEPTFLFDLLQKTAWPMTPPAFHIIFSLLGLAASGFLAAFLGRRHKAHASLILWNCGVILGVSEVYKQLFIYEVVNHGCYDWWYFPFQLCSTCAWYFLCLARRHREGQPPPIWNLSDFWEGSWPWQNPPD